VPGNKYESSTFNSYIDSKRYNAQCYRQTERQTVSCQKQIMLRAAVYDRLKRTWFKVGLDYTYRYSVVGNYLTVHITIQAYL